MPRKKKKSTDSDGLRVSYPKTKKSRRRREDDDHWSSDFEDGLEAGFAAAEIASDLIMAILRFF
jgi:hypothetical protein